jgi:hypothetical protein
LQKKRKNEKCKTFIVIQFPFFYIQKALFPFAEECTIMTRGVGEGRLVYIRNKWKKEGLKFWLKEWDPDLPDGIMFVIRPLSGDNYYKLVIGAEENEKVQLFYGVGEGETTDSFQTDIIQFYLKKND